MVLTAPVAPGGVCGASWHVCLGIPFMSHIAHPVLVSPNTNQRALDGRTPLPGLMRHPLTLTFASQLKPLCHLRPNTCFAPALHTAAPLPRARYHHQHGLGSSGLTTMGLSMAVDSSLMMLGPNSKRPSHDLVGNTRWALYDTCQATCRRHKGCGL